MVLLLSKQVLTFKKRPQLRRGEKIKMAEFHAYLNKADQPRRITDCTLYDRWIVGESLNGKGMKWSFVVASRRCCLQRLLNTMYLVIYEKNATAMCKTHMNIRNKYKLAITNNTFSKFEVITNWSHLKPSFFETYYSRTGSNIFGNHEKKFEAEEVRGVVRANEY